MAEEPDEVVLMLRGIETKIDRLINGEHEPNVRRASVEENLTGVQRRIDRLEDRMDRVERRLDLVGTEK